MRPRVGARKTSRSLPPPVGRISCISPLPQRHLLDDDAGEGIVDIDPTSSIGSRRSPVGVGPQDNAGAAVESSKPSRRIVSIRTPDAARRGPRLRRRRALRSHGPGARHCLRIRASGDRDHARRHLGSLAAGQRQIVDEKIMSRVGGSTGIDGIGISTSGVQIVSATVVSARPAMAMISPASASSIGRRSRPRKASSFVRRNVLDTLPSRDRD